MLHNQSAKNERLGKRIGRKEWMCLFEFKILRTIQILLVHTLARGKNCLHFIKAYSRFYDRVMVFMIRGQP